MMDPREESFWDSKTMVLLCIGMAAIVLLIVIGIVVMLLTDKDPFQMVTAGILGISGQSGQGTYRNAKVDAPIRQAYAAQQTGFTPGQLNSETPTPPANIGAYGPPGG